MCCGSLKDLPETAGVGINRQVQSAVRHVTPEPVVWLCLHACYCGCSVSWYLFYAKHAMLLLRGLNIGAVALASLILSAVTWMLLSGGLLTQKDLEHGVEGRKRCRETKMVRLTLSTSILLPLSTVLCVALERQGLGIALSQLMLLHQARGARSL